jgi:hypothetical protein
MLVLTCTVNLPEIAMSDDEAAIKNYSENKGMVEALKEANIILDKVREVKSGFVTIPIYKLNLDLIKNRSD